MTSKQILAVVALIVVLGAAVAFGGYTSVGAQGNGNTTPTPYSPGTQGYGWNGQGMMGGNWPGMMGNNWQNQPMWTAVATALGIDVNTLFTELQSGKTLPQIAEARGIDVQTVYDAVLTTMTDYMNTMVASGYITEVQAQAQLTWMRDNIAQMLTFNGTGFGPCHMGGMMGNYGQGMMGYGMHGGMYNGYMGQGMMNGSGWYGQGMHGWDD
ncbi:MAG: hypothetical protein K8L91_04700 [Anaerolineae bacterium]|nr:hypothetical protein [Anaerolineae bacterium]